MMMMMMTSSGVKRSQSVKCSNNNNNNNQFSVMSPNVDFLAELRNNRQFKKQEAKFRETKRLSVSLEDLRSSEKKMVIREDVKKKSGSEVTLYETKSSLLTALLGRGGGRNVSIRFFKC